MTTGAVGLCAPAVRPGAPSSALSMPRASPALRGQLERVPPVRRALAPRIANGGRSQQTGRRTQAAFGGLAIDWHTEE